MVWQTHTTQIVMLTNLVEGTKVRTNCHVNTRKNVVEGTNVSTNCQVNKRSERKKGKFYLLS